MLEHLQQYSISLLKNQKIEYKRYFFNEVNFSDKLIGIIGDRGIGKTTFLLQYLNSLELPYTKKLYVSAEFLLLNNITLQELAEEFVKVGGEVLVIDEIHHIQDFEKYLKIIYDFFDLQVLFSGSNAIKLEHSKADLSRRALLYRFGGMSFREFLELKTSRKFASYSLDEILTNHIEIAAEITRDLKPFEFWNEYLQYGYYPFYFQTPKSSFLIKLNETINTTIEHDLAYIFNIEPKFVIKLKQLVGLICTSKPYELNITKLSQKIEINRNTLYQYIYYLNRGKIFNIFRSKTKGDNIFLKPDKIYLNNTNLNYSYCNNQSIGTIRETYFANQVGDIHRLEVPNKGDFLIDDTYTVEIGGKDKKFTQIKDIKNSYVVADNIEIGFGNKIPLWLFGFLY